jgi:hypothetical protein
LSLRVIIHIPILLLSFRTLQGHGHWVNVLALNTDYVMRTGAFDPAKATIVHEDLGTTTLLYHPIRVPFAVRLCGSYKS